MRCFCPRYSANFSGYFGATEVTSTNPVNEHDEGIKALDLGLGHALLRLPESERLELEGAWQALSIDRVLVL